jgi:hypothetical protein
MLGVIGMTSVSVAVPTTVPDLLRIRATGPIFFVCFERISHVLVPSRIWSIHGVRMGIAESVVMLFLRFYMRSPHPCPIQILVGIVGIIDCQEMMDHHEWQLAKPQRLKKPFRPKTPQLNSFLSKQA